MFTLYKFQLFWMLLCQTLCLASSAGASNLPSLRWLPSGRADFEEGRVDNSLIENDDGPREYAGTECDHLASTMVTVEGRVFRTGCLRNPTAISELPLANPEIGFGFDGDGSSDFPDNFSPLLRVKTTDKVPYRVIGQIRTGCSGTLISPRHVLTAGHCVYNSKTKRWYSNLSFSPGRNGERASHPSVAWKNVYAPDGWTKFSERDYDYAVIELEKSIGDKLRWLPIRVSPESNSIKISIAGYPSNRPKGSMWEATCSTDITYIRRLYYKCETSGGMSGSAIRNRASQSSGESIIGVHSYGGTSENRGSRISQEIYNQIAAWVAIRNPIPPAPEEPPIPVPSRSPVPVQPPERPYVAAFLAGQYRGTFVSSEPNTNLPERFMLNLVDAGSRLTGNLRLYAGAYGSAEYSETSLTEATYNPSARRLTLHTQHYGISLIGPVGRDLTFLADVFTADLGKIGQVILRKTN